MPKFGTKVSHFRCDSHTSFKVKRSKVRVTRPINADTHRAPYLPNGNCLRTLNLVYGWRTTTHINHRCHDLQGQKSRSHGHVITLSRVGPVAHKSKTNSPNITNIGRRVSHDTCYIAHQFLKVKRSKVRVTGRLTQTHKMCDIFRTVRLKNFKVKVRMEDVNAHQRQAP